MPCSSGGRTRLEASAAHLRVAGPSSQNSECSPYKVRIPCAYYTFSVQADFARVRAPSVHSRSLVQHGHDTYRLFITCTYSLSVVVLVRRAAASTIRVSCCESCRFLLLL